jgi:hypothetical protein
VSQSGSWKFLVDDVQLRTAWGARLACVNATVFAWPNDSNNQNETIDFFEVTGESSIPAIRFGEINEVAPRRLSSSNRIFSHEFDYPIPN